MIHNKPRYVLDADIAQCFDRINHQALLAKLATFPALRRVIKAWLTAGILEGDTLFPSQEGTPQGGVVSPLLANIALHGEDPAIRARFPKTLRRDGKVIDNWKPFVVRYADDVRHLTQDEILLAEKGGSEEQDLRVISPTWARKPKGKGACEKRGKRVKTLKRCPARPA